MGDRIEPIKRIARGKRIYPNQNADVDRYRPERLLENRKREKIFYIGAVKAYRNRAGNEHGLFGGFNG